MLKRPHLQIRLLLQKESFLDQVDLNALYELLLRGITLVSDWSSRILEQVIWLHVLKRNL
jgi:hypothetical protein